MNLRNTLLSLLCLSALALFGCDSKEAAQAPTKMTGEPQKMENPKVDTNSIPENARGGIPAKPPEGFKVQTTK